MSNKKLLIVHRRPSNDNVLDKLDNLSNNYEIEPSHFKSASPIISSLSTRSDPHEDNGNQEMIDTIKDVSSSIVALVSIFLIETINLSFVGHLKESRLNLEAVGVGNILLNFTSLFLVFGALGALDTVGSVCFGTKDFNNLAKNTVRMRIIIVAIFFIFTIPSCIYTEKILNSLGIAPDISERSGHYTFTMIPAIFFIFNFNLNVRFVQIMHDYFIVSLIAAFTVVIHYAMNYYCFYNTDFKYITVAIISNISTCIGFILSSIYCAYFNKYPESVVFYNDGIFNYHEFKFLAKLAFHSAIQHYGDFVGYEIVTFLGVYLPIPAENSASLVLLNYSVITAYVYSGSSFPLTQKIGYAMGMEDEIAYKKTIYTYTKLNFVVGGLLTFFTIVFAEQILSFYTRNTVIIDLAYPIIILYAIFSLIDNINVMFQGVLKGTGNQHIPSVYNVIFTVFITVPVSYILAFTFDYGVIGLWAGIFSFMTAMMFVSMYYVFSLDFKENSKYIKENIVNDDEENIIQVKY